MRRYFAFIDGSLAYQCVPCGARCCHGLGFSLARDEIVPILRRAPRLAPFVQPQGPGFAVLTLTSEGCWFLRPDLRCDIEVTDGRPAKPAVCRLFPFNQLYRVGEVLVIEPQLLRCPLEDASGAGARHQDIAADLDGLSADELPLQRAHLPAALPDHWADAEEAAREQAASLSPDSPLSLVQALAPESDAPHLAALWQGWDAALGPAAPAGPGAPPPAGHVARLLRLIWPALRFTTLFGGTPGAGPYPRLVQRLPSLLLATAWLSLRAAALLPRPLTLRGVAEVHRGTVLLRDLLSRWDRPLSLTGEVPMPPTLPEPAQAAARRLFAALSAPTPLSAALPAALEGDAEAAFLLLRLLSDRPSLLRYHASLPPR